MKFRNVIILLWLMSCAGLTYGADEYYFKFNIDSIDKLKSLTRVVSIDKVIGNEVFAYANGDQLYRFKQLGISYTELPHPGTMIVPKMFSGEKDVYDWDTYPTYETYVDMMNQFAFDYPNLCMIENIGSSILGRDILFAKISDNILDEEDEPEVLFTSTIHGDETTGYVLMLRLINYILTNYGSDSLATRLVDSCEIWINPLANPDGTYRYDNSTLFAATRYNIAGVDLNRNFPDPQMGDHPDGYSWQSETIAMMDFASAHSFDLAANFHGGIEVINYPWDTWAKYHSDNDWWIDISRDYADSAQYYSPSGYMTALNYGITNGYDWYQVFGGRQDYMNYWHHCRECTAEISDTKLLGESLLPAHWDYNKISFLNYAESSLDGIRGIITDSETGLPVDARITVLGYDIDNSEVYTDPDVGDYHRMIESGTYDLEFSADGYLLDTVFSITVADYSTTRVDVELLPAPDEPSLLVYDFGIIVVEPGDFVSMPITLINLGGVEATGVSAVLSTTDPYISITAPSSTFPDIPASGGTGISASYYEFTVDPECPPNYSVSFELEISNDIKLVEYDNFEFIIEPYIENFESDDFDEFEWQMTGAADWIITGSFAYEGAFAAQSGNIGNSQYSQLSLEVDVAEDGVISFYSQTDSEYGRDLLKFYIDGSQKQFWSGSSGWNLFKYPVTAGVHTFSWRYEKNDWSSFGQDCGRIDYLIFPPLNLPFLCGDVDLNGLIDILDIVYLIDHKFKDHDPPQNMEIADVNNDHIVDILDIVLLIDLKFKDGPDPDCNG